MQEVFDRTQELTNRISLSSKSYSRTEIFMQRDKKIERIEDLVSLFRKLSPEEFRPISEPELTRRIAKLLTWEAVSGTLNDLTTPLSSFHFLNSKRVA